MLQLFCTLGFDLIFMSLFENMIATAKRGKTVEKREASNNNAKKLR